MKRNDRYYKSEFYKNGVEMHELIDAVATEREDCVVTLDGLDEALTGYSIDLEGKMHAVYSVSSCIKVFMRRDGMSREDALDFYSYNTERALPYAASSGNVPIMVWDFV